MHSATRRLLFALAAALVLAACGSPGPAEAEFSGASMGTTWSVKVVTDAPLSPAAREEAARAIDDAIERVNATMSTYREDSELSRFNRSASLDPFPVSAETLAVFVEARQVGEWTDGVFDVTVGPLVNAWGFGPDKPRAELSAEEIDELRARVGWDKLEIDETNSTLAKRRPDLYCDLSAIAKGYAVDLVAERLGALSYSRHMVEIGGEVRAKGANSQGRPWRIAIERPDPVPGQTAFQRVLDVVDSSVATSGDYHNYIERNGRRLSHEIDPRTGRPIEHRAASVTVLDTTCARADALATGLIVLGEDEGFRRAVELEIAALFLVREGDGFVERATPAFERQAGAGRRLQ